MGFLGANPNFSNVNVQVNLPENLKLLQFTHIVRDASKERRWSLPSSGSPVTVPGGYFFLEVNNTSLQNLTITINSNPMTLMPGQKFNSEDRLDWEHFKQELGPPVQILNNTGEGIAIHVCYPSDSAVNPYTI